jgi:hypothetical protein
MINQFEVIWKDRIDSFNDGKVPFNSDFIPLLAGFILLVSNNPYHPAKISTIDGVFDGIASIENWLDQMLSDEYHLTVTSIVRGFVEAEFYVFLNCKSQTDIVMCKLLWPEPEMVKL